MSFLTLIPLLPLLACLTLTLAGRRLGEASQRVGIAAVAASFGLSIAAFLQVWHAGPQTTDLYRLLQAGSLVVDLGFYVDQLAVLLLLLVTGVSTIVHVYAGRYMTGDPRYPRFFAIIALFTSAMLVLVMSRNLLMTYMSWEAMGICSYLLISHWAHRSSSGRAALKAFLVNAVADVGLGCGVLLTFQTFGTLDIPTVLNQAVSLGDHSVNVLGWAGYDWPVRTTTLISLLLFMGALGKSAQLPFHVWLPFAMEAPTPVSALIHAATMVNAGPFLLVRFSPMLILAPGAMTVIAIVGGATALFAALVSMTQSDIKKILAYSTISQIGFMIMCCGVGAFAAAVFHLLAHGFLKAFLFLSTGNALQSLTPHAAHSHAPRSGGSSSVMAGTLVFACVPPAMLFSGPYEALWTMTGTPASRIAFWIIALATVFFTAIYLVRTATGLFLQEFTLHETRVRPRLFSAPHALIVATGALVLTAFLYGFPAWFAAFIAPSLPRATASVEASAAGAAWSWSLLPFVVAAAGWGVASFRRHDHVPATTASSGALDGLYVMLWNKLYFDEIYDRCIVEPSLRFARGLANTVEHGVIDGLLNGLVGLSARTAIWLWRVLEGRGIDRAVNSTATASVQTASWLWRVLEGRGIQRTSDRLSDQADAVGRFFNQRELHTLQEHLLLVVGGLAALLAVFYFIIHGS